MPYFRFPRPFFPPSYQYYPKYVPLNNQKSSQNIPVQTSFEKSEKKNNSTKYEKYFFELFGLELYFDDILLICLIFFLYQEGVKDEELFISLILLLLS